MLLKRQLPRQKLDALLGSERAGVLVQQTRKLVEQRQQRFSALEASNKRMPAFQKAAERKKIESYFERDLKELVAQAVGKHSTARGEFFPRKAKAVLYALGALGVAFSTSNEAAGASVSAFFVPPAVNSAIKLAKKSREAIRHHSLKRALKEELGLKKRNAGKPPEAAVLQDA